MPYRLNHYQYYTFPSKLAEYLMGGLPIVARRLPELEHYQNVVSISDTVEQMAKDIEHLLSVDARRDVRLLVERKQVANTLTWEAQIETIEAAIMDTESKPYA
jgi:glycosyltransferase involved in cell wall biosynthesis